MAWELPVVPDGPGPSRAVLRRHLGEAPRWLGDSRGFRGREQHLKRGFLACISAGSQSKIQVEIVSGEEDPGRSETVQWFPTF